MSFTRPEITRVVLFRALARPLNQETSALVLVAQLAWFYAQEDLHRVPVPQRHSSRRFQHDDSDLQSD